MTLVNRLVEWRRWHRDPLRARAASVRERRPVVVVPSILGTRIADERGRLLWGSAVRLYGGPSITMAARASAAGTLDGFTIVPGVYQYDIFGGLVRSLERVAGYRRGIDLFVLQYDWRRSVADGAARLADLVARVRSRDGLDVVAVSTGGLVVRHFLAATNERIGRVVYIGTPHRGTFQALSALHEGLQMVPFGRRFASAELAGCQTAWDALPHPDERVFIDEAGAPLALSLYEPATWRTLRLCVATRDLEHQLERAERLHRALDAAPVHADSVVIGARHLPTLSKLPVVRDRAVLPACTPRRGDPLAPVLFEPGDSSLPARSLEALPGLARDRIRAVTPDEHHLLPADAAVHRLTIEALIA